MQKRTEIPEILERQMKPVTRTIEITTSLSAKIPIAQYENLSPFYAIKETITTEDIGDELISKRTDELRALLAKKLDEDYERIRIENIKKTRSEIRFYERGGKQYPSVTSILSAIEPINYDPIKLRQYASRGTVVHAQVDHFFKTGIWETDPLKIPNTKLDVLIVTQGDLKLKWDDCNFMGFWEKNKEDFDVEATEVKLFNDEYQYAGTSDIICTYKGKKTIADVKTASTYDNDKLDKYFRQLSAYARCIPDVEQMVIIPLNPSNKSGFGAPIVETDINRYFAAFLNDRSAFTTLYGI